MTDGVTIPAHIHERELAALRREYERVVVKITDEVREIERDEAIEIYARNVKFWRARLPKLSKGMGEAALARHAICTNADINLMKRIKELGIHDEVLAHVDGSE